MRLGLAAMIVFAAIAPSIGVNAQDAAQGAAKDKAPKAAAKAPAKSKMVLLCPQQKAGGDKVNVACADGEKCCYNPLFDNGSCVPEAQGCMGVINPLPRVAR